MTNCSLIITNRSQEATLLTRLKSSPCTDFSRIESGQDLLNKEIFSPESEGGNLHGAGFR